MNNENPKITEKDFVFVQQDKQIHDLKFETKPTTYLKDALKRFIKNKSSVVAGGIISFLILLSIFVPIFNHNDINSSQNELRFLPPRWPGFANTSILNGQKDYKGIIVDMKDPDGPIPDGFVRSALIGDLSMYDGEITSASKHGRGGHVLLNSDAVNTPIAFASTYIPAVDFANTYSLTVNLDDTLNRSLTVLPAYSLAFDVEYTSGVITEVIVRPESSVFGEAVVSDVSSIVLANKPSSLSLEQTSFRTRVRIIVKELASAKSSLYFDKLVVTNVNDAADLTFASHNFVEGNEVLYRLRDNLAVNRFNVSAISPTIGGQVSLIGAKATFANFRYDPYEAAYGKKRMRLNMDHLRDYKEKGWIDFDAGPNAILSPDPELIISTLQILDTKKSPLIEIVDYEVGTVSGLTFLEFVADVTYYRFLGLNSMPNFLFGTNKAGHDYFKTVFNGLGISLLLGVVVALINIIIGLVWGAISGYYGGAVDLFMERITEILGGIPTIVVLTLVILHLGNSFPVFILAMILTGWIGIAATTRSQFYRYKRREYVMASRTLGAKDSRLIFKHILPNSIGPIVTGAVLMIPGIIFTEATISYLGLGLKGMPSLGVSLSSVQNEIFTEPYLIISGAIVVSLLMISFNLFGNGLRDAFNPSLKGVE